MGLENLLRTVRDFVFFGQRESMELSLASSFTMFNGHWGTFYPFKEEIAEGLGDNYFIMVMQTNNYNQSRLGVNINFNHNLTKTQNIFEGPEK